MQDVLWCDAEKIVVQAFAIARERNLAIAVAVVDHGRELKAFGRADEAMLVTIQLAIGKAYTSCSMNRPTRDLAERTWSGSDLFGLETAHVPALVAIGGGAPLRRSGQLVGAVGISGGTPEQDHELAAWIANQYEAETLEDA